MSREVPRLIDRRRAHGQQKSLVQQFQALLDRNGKARRALGVDLETSKAAPVQVFFQTYILQPWCALTCKRRHRSWGKVSAPLRSAPLRCSRPSEASWSWTAWDPALCASPPCFVSCSGTVFQPLGLKELLVLFSEVIAGNQNLTQYLGTSRYSAEKKACQTAVVYLGRFCEDTAFVAHLNLRSPSGQHLHDGHLVCLDDETHLKSLKFSIGPHCEASIISRLCGCLQGEGNCNFAAWRRVVSARS